MKWTQYGDFSVLALVYITSVSPGISWEDASHDEAGDRTRVPSGPKVSCGDVTCHEWSVSRRYVV